MDNEAQFAHRLRPYLNRGARVDARVAARLRAAREQALAAYQPASNEWVALHAGAGSRLGGLRGLWWRILLPTAVLCVAFTATYAWQQQQGAAEVEELDALLLSSDLPIDAYLDQGFAAWLKRRASQ